MPPCHATAAGLPQCWHQLLDTGGDPWPGALALAFRGRERTPLTMIKKALRFPFLSM
jgi:hypothetical protein